MQIKINPLTDNLANFYRFQQSLFRVIKMLKTITVCRVLLFLLLLPPSLCMLRIGACKLGCTFKCQLIDCFATNETVIRSPLMTLAICTFDVKHNTTRMPVFVFHSMPLNSCFNQFTLFVAHQFQLFPQLNRAHFPKILVY